MADAIDPSLAMLLDSKDIAALAPPLYLILGVVTVEDLFALGDGDLNELDLGRLERMALQRLIIEKPAWRQLGDVRRELQPAWPRGRPSVWPPGHRASTHQPPTDYPDEVSATQPIARDPPPSNPRARSSREDSTLVWSAIQSDVSELAHFLQMNLK